MSSIHYGGKLLMRVNEYDEDYEYPLPIPKVFIEAYGEDYNPRALVAGYKDSAVIVRDKSIMEYTKTVHYEFLAEDETGNIIWVDGRTSPEERCWKGKDFYGHRRVQMYSVVEYDLNSSVKRTYNVIPEAVSEFDGQDVKKIMEFYGEEEFCHDFTIRDHKVHRRVDENNDDYH